MPNIQQCPAVVVIGVPVRMRRGPAMTPLRTASRIGNAISFLLPMSRSVVTPLISTARTFAAARRRSASWDSVVTSRYASGVAEQCMWAWTSTRPGRSETSPRSWIRWVPPTSRGSSFWGTTARIRSPSVRTA